MPKRTTNATTIKPTKPTTTQLEITCALQIVVRRKGMLAMSRGRKSLSTTGKATAAMKVACPHDME